MTRLNKLGRMGRAALMGSAILGGSLLIAEPARAQDTANLVVTAEVTANCTISSTGLAFGAYDPVSTNAAANLDGTGTISVTCTSGSTGDITLGQGANPKAGSDDTAPLRQMSAGGTDRLEYFLYQETGRITVWGNTAATDVSHPGTGTSTDLTVYGRVTAGQNVAAGSYTDTVVATVTF